MNGCVVSAITCADKPAASSMTHFISVKDDLFATAPDLRHVEAQSTLVVSMNCDYGCVDGMYPKVQQVRPYSSAMAH